MMDWTGSYREADRGEKSPWPQRSLMDVGLARWRLILLTAAVCTVLAGLLTMVLPKKYAAEMQLLVKNGRQDLTLSPDRTNPTMVAPEVTESEVNSEMRLLQSRNLLEAVVLDTKLYQRYQRAGQGAPTPQAVELATMRLAKELQVSAVRKTSVIQASYRAGGAEQAAAVLKDLGDRYLQAHLAAHSTPGSLAFFTAQLEDYRHRLDGAQAASSAFRRSTGIFSPDQQRSALVAQYEDTNAHLQEGSAELLEARARLAALTAEAEKAPARIGTEERTSVNSLSVDHLQTELADLENRRIGMLMKYRPEDRAVRELDDEITNTRRNLGAAKTEYSAESTTTVNGLHETLLADLSDARVKLQTLQARQSALQAARVQYLAQLKSFDIDAVALSDLNRTEELDQQSYRFYGERMEAARAASAMDKDNFANVAIIETPVASPIPVSPVLPLNLAMGLCLGLVAGFSLALLWPGSGNGMARADTGLRGFSGEALSSTVAGD